MTLRVIHLGAFPNTGGQGGWGSSTACGLFSRAFARHLVLAFGSLEFPVLVAGLARRC